MRSMHGMNSDCSRYQSACIRHSLYSKDSDCRNILTASDRYPMARARLNHESLCPHHGAQVNYEDFANGPDAVHNEMYNKTTIKLAQFKEKTVYIR